MDISWYINNFHFGTLSFDNSSKRGRPSGHCATLRMFVDSSTAGYFARSSDAGMRRQKSKLIQNISCNLQDATKLFSTGRNKKYIFHLNEEIPSYKSWFLTSCMISPELCSIQIYCEHLFMVNKMRKLYSLWLKLFIMLNNKMTKLQNIRN